MTTAMRTVTISVGVVHDDEDGFRAVAIEARMMMSSATVMNTLALIIVGALFI